MTFHVKLEGALQYPDAKAAADAHASMMKGRAGNRMLEDGARLDGKEIVFRFENALSSSNPSDLVDSTEFGIEKALESAVTGSVVYSDETGFRRVRHALGREFWARRWQDGQTGFHEGKPNDLLAAHIARIEKPHARIFVPLCGKAFDVRWLAERGHEVVGVECVWEAVRGFFDDWEQDPPRTEMGRAPVLAAKGVTLICANIFDVRPEELGRFDVIYDRAALVALEPSTRARYVEACQALLGEGGKTFLVTLAYDQSVAPGPPWSIDAAMVQTLYAGRSIETLETRQIPTSPRLTAAGAPTFTETAFLVT